MYGPGLWCLDLVYDVTDTDCWALFMMSPIQIAGPGLWCHRYILLGLVYDVTVQIAGPGLWCHQYRLLGTKWQHLHSYFFVISKHGFKKQDEKWSENQLCVYFLFHSCQQDLEKSLQLGPPWRFTALSWCNCSVNNNWNNDHSSSLPHLT